tara:strand:- start:1421 stop:2011 length:591 start_codon:yes stop_codon:yes gene_type:complete
MKIFNENNKLVDINNIEVNEQRQARNYINENDIVLEIGARYGSVSCIVNSILNNKKNQVVVEPDNRVWDALEKNKKINNCDFEIVKGFISNKNLKLNYLNCPYSTFSSEGQSDIPSYKLKDISNLKFNVLIADCEGFLGEFLEENEYLLNDLRLIIMEQDNPQVCDYDKIILKLTLEYGFKCIEPGFNCVFIKPQP